MRPPDAPADPQPNSSAPRYIGPYRLISPLSGQGETVCRYKALHSELNRYALVKLIPAGEQNDSADEAFRREVQALAALRHPHIVTVYDFGRYESGYYLATEYLPGPDLAQVIAQNHPLPRAQVQAVIADVAAALDCAHAHGVIHRHLSPSRIFLGDDRGVILADFDLALPVSQETATADHRLDAPYYLAPEQAISADSASPASDIYALGAILFELLAATPPYVADSPLGVALKHVEAPIPNVCEFSPNVPPAVGTVIQQAMAKDPAQRFASATQLAQALAQAWATPENSSSLLESASPLTTGIHPGGQPTNPQVYAYTPSVAARPVTRSSRFWWGLAAILILLILSAGVWGFLRRPQSPVAVAATQPIAAALPSPSASPTPVLTPTPPTTATPVLRQSQSDSISLITTPTLIISPATASPERLMVTETPVVMPPITPVPTDTPVVLLTITPVSPVITYTPTTEDLLAGLRGRILFKTDRSGRVEIFQMNADGSGQLPLDPERAYLYNEVVRWEAFSPGRQETVVVRGEGQLDLWRINLADGNETRITSDGAADYDPVWSPGNNRLAFVSDRTGNGDVYLLNLDGSGETRLTLNEGDFDKHPSWSPTGDQLVFWSDRGAGKYWQIWLFDLKTGQSANLSNNTFRDWDPVWVK